MLNGRDAGLTSWSDLTLMSSTHKEMSKTSEAKHRSLPTRLTFRRQALPLGNESSDSWTTWAGCNPSHPTIALETSLLLMRYFRYDFRLKTTWGMPLAIRNLLEASDFGSSVISGRHRRLCRWESWGFLVKTHPHSGQFGTGVGKAELSWRWFQISRLFLPEMF